MRRLPPETGPELTIEYERQPLSAREGEPAACALLAAGETVFSRSIKYHRPRGPFCMAGSCSNCLMRSTACPTGSRARRRCDPGCASSGRTRTRA